MAPPDATPAAAPPSAPPPGRLAWLREVPAKRAAAFTIIGLVGLGGVAAILEAFPIFAVLVTGVGVQWGLLPESFLP